MLRCCLVSAAMPYSPSLRFAHAPGSRFALAMPGLCRNSASVFVRVRCGRAAPPTTRLLRRRDGCRVARLLEQAQAVLDLRDAELQLLVLRAEDEAELTQETVHAGAGALGHPRRVAAPA